MRISVSSLTVPLCIALVTATPVLSQERTRLQDNDVTTGSLAPGDGKLDAGEFFDAYEVLLTAGQRIQIDLTSSDFDTYLVLFGPGGSDATENDDFEGATDRSQITLEADQTGSYTIFATSFGGGETGSYRLALQSSPASQASSSGSPGVRVQEISGRLEAGDRTVSDGSFIDQFTVAVEANKYVEVVLEAEDFDTYLMVVAPDGERFENDDYEGSTRASQVAFTTTQAGELMLGASAYAKGVGGSYSLTLRVHDAGPRALPGQYAEPFSAAIFEEASIYGDRVHVFTIVLKDGDRVFGQIDTAEFEPMLLLTPPGASGSNPRISFNGAFDVTAEQDGELRLGVASGDDRFGAFSLTANYRRAYSEVVAFENLDYCPAIERVLEEAPTWFENLKAEERMTLLGLPEWIGTVIPPEADECLVAAFTNDYRCDFDVSLNTAPLLEAFGPVSTTVRSCLGNGWDFTSEPSSPPYSEGDWLAYLKATRGERRIELGVRRTNLSYPKYSLRLIVANTGPRPN